MPNTPPPPPPQTPPPPPPNMPPPPPEGPSLHGAKPWWKRWWGITIIAFVALVVIGSMLPDTDENLAVEDAATEASPSPPETSESASPSPTPTATTPSPPPEPSPTPTADPVAEVRGDDAPVVLTGVVADIVDGDTIDLADGTRVRLAIVDTPEVHGGKEQCGDEASQFTRDAVLGEQVSIIRPPGAPAIDDFDRTLGEVVREDGYSLNVELAAAGLATVDERFTSEDPDLATRARAAQESADAPSCAAVAPPPPPEPEPEPTSQEPAPGGNCHPAYTPCVPPPPPDLNCADVNGPIQVDHAHGDPHGFDRDGDGVGCEG